jgi:hypothetical protein
LLAKKKLKGIVRGRTKSRRKKNTTRETGREYRYRILQSDSGKTGRKKSDRKEKNLEKSPVKKIRSDSYTIDYRTYTIRLVHEGDRKEILRSDSGKPEGKDLEKSPVKKYDWTHTR